VVRRVNINVKVVSSDTEKDYHQDEGRDSYGEFIKGGHSGRLPFSYIP
jgi:hypothetical protein